MFFSAVFNPDYGLLRPFYWCVTNSVAEEKSSETLSLLPPSLFFSHSSYTSTETGSSCLLSPRPESNLEFLSTRWTLVYKGQTLSKKNTKQKASPLAGSKCSQKTFRYCILVRVSAYLIDGVCIEVFSLGRCVTISASLPSSWNPLCINQGDRWSCLSCPRVLLLHQFSLKRRDDRSS